MFRLLALPGLKVGVVTLVMGAVVSFTVFVVIHMLWEHILLFLIVAPLVFVYLSQQATASDAVGKALYLLAGTAATSPFVYLLHVLVSFDNPDGGGLFIAEVVFTLLFRLPAAILVAVLLTGSGYYLVHRIGNGQEAKTQE